MQEGLGNGRGALSGYVRDQDIAIIEKHFPKATLHTVEGAGHWVHAEKPKAFIALLDALLTLSFPTPS